MSDANTTQLPGAPLRSRTHGASHDFGSVLAGVWRRKWIPLLSFAAGIGIGVLALIVTPAQYRANAQIMIEVADNNTGVLQSEAAIIQSTPVLSKVAGMLRLYRDDEFKRPGLFDALMFDGNDENATRDRVMKRLMRMIDVSIVRGTSIIDMTVRHPDPDRAAQIANALLTSYQERKVDERFEQSRQIGGWMSKRLETIKEEGAGAKQRLQDFQSLHGAFALSGADMKAERMAMLNRAMGDTQSQIAELSARIEEAKNGKRGGRDAVDNVLKSERLLNLKKTESAMTANLAQMQGRYGDKHPKIITQRAELARVREDISKETGNVMSSLEQDLAAAKGRLVSLQMQADEMTADADADGRLKVELDNLESDVAANSRLYADFMTKYQDLLATTELRMADMKVISMATIPAHPDQRARMGVVLGLGIIGFFCGLLYVLLRILWSKGFTSAEQLESMTGYPVFAAVPMAKKGTDEAVHHAVMQDPAALLAESLRSLRVSLRLRGDTGRRPRVVAFTSTLPDEGKTSMAVMLAMIAAKSGERVCVVDCDLRRPSLHKAFGIGAARGLTDYLSDRLGLDEVIYRKDPSGVHLITAKAVPSYSLTLLTSGRMERLIGALREQYDLVILDAPSSLAFADARVLARMVDQTLYVVAWNRTRRESVNASLKAYADMGYADLALVLNKVDLSEYLRDSAAAVIYQYGAGDESFAT